MGITDIDPIRYNLIFERFLNPERVSMPDFDVDFCYERRQEVIDYVNRKYGADHVAQIVTFGTMAARNAIRDVGRVMGMPYQEVDVVAKQVPAELKMTIKHALEVSPELRRMYETDPKVTELLDTAMKVEGMPRHASTHAAGVVITPEPTDYYLPLATNDGLPVTQFNMTEIEELGLLKMDFLGLRTLTVIRDAELAIQKKEPDLDITTLGEANFIITFKNKPGPGILWEWIKILFVGLATFFGAGFSIMTFNNDVDIPALFEQIYTQVTGQPTTGNTVLEISYSLGIGLGVLFFFNHFGRIKLTDDPTPMQVQMRLYEDDVNTTIIEDDSRKKE